MSRQPEFDRDEVVSSAMELFWRKGFESASVQELLDAMGINRGSMYATFGGKRDLFISALEMYVAEIESFAKECLMDARDPLEGLRRFLETVLVEPDADRRALGCFLVNTISEQAHLDVELADRAREYTRRLECGFEACLQQARAKGLLPQHSNTGLLARYVRCNLYGMRVLAKEGLSTREISELLNLSLGALSFGHT